MAGQLHRRGLAPTVCVSADELALARWAYRSGTTGEGAEVRLADGTQLDSRRLRGVLNRLLAVPAATLLHVVERDRDYVGQELTALLTSWLHGLPCPVLGRPSGACLCGAWADRSEWRRQACAAGLPTLTYRLSAEAHAGMPPDRFERVVLVDGRVARGRPPEELLPALARFAGRGGHRLIEAQFMVEGARNWRFADATLLPDLSHADDALVDALAVALTAP